MSHRGLLLVNLGTPDEPQPDAVGRYLKEFLMDGRVIDIPYFVRWPLVNWIIAPRRKYKSAEAYQEIWTEEGSPLLTNSVDFYEAIKAELHEVRIELAMRYGNPSIQSGLKKLRDSGVQELSILPMYPHYAMSSTLTVLEKVEAELKAMSWEPKLRHLQSFYNNEGYIKVLSENCKRLLSDGFKPDYYLMSYHGLPMRHLTKLNKSCAANECCTEASDRSSTCYRYQAFQTTHLLAKELGLTDGTYETSFQSRLGPGWIQPFTDVRLKELAESGIKNLVVFSPSFVSDCLESLEEIQIGGAEIFKDAGGSELRMVSSLNSEPEWVHTVADLYHNEKTWLPGLY